MFQRSSASWRKPASAYFIHVAASSKEYCPQMTWNFSQMREKNRFSHIRYPVSVIFFLFLGGISAILIAVGTAFAQWQTQPQTQLQYGETPVGGFEYTVPSNSATPATSTGSYHATPFQPAPINPDPTLSNSQAGARHISEITPTTNSPQYDPQMMTVPLEQNYQYLDPTISDLHPKEMTAEELPDTWRMNSTR